MRPIHQTTVLVIEDNPDNRLILTDLLEYDCGMQCLAAASGWQAFKLLREQNTTHIDLVLLDLQLPAEDGYGVLNRIRATPSLEGVRVIAVTANSSVADIARCRSAGFDGFLGKPISQVRFPNQLRRILAGEAVWEPH